MRLVQIILAAIGIINFFLVALFLFFVKKGNIKANRIFGLLLLAICLKLSYAFLINFPHEWGILSITIYLLAEISYYSFVPLLLIYIRALCKKEIKLILIITFVLISVIYSFLDFFFYDFPLWCGQVYYLIFLIITFQQLRFIGSKNDKSNAVETDKIWLWILFVSFVLIWVAVDLLIFDFKMYFLEICSIFTILFYTESYILVKQYWLRKGDEKVTTKYLNSILTKKEENEIILRLQKLMDDENLFIDSEISLPKVARKINVKPYKLSQVINQSLNMSFNEYINIHRIKAIKSAIQESDQDIKIASHAYEYGFNSISSFNTAFKRITGLTPSQYRSEILLNNTTLCVKIDH
jgi:AraC-like DNA-binding protein